MNNQNKEWNIELLYSVIFFTSAQVVFWLDLNSQAWEFLYSFKGVLYNYPIPLEILKLTLLTINAVDVTMILNVFFLFLSVVCGVLSLRNSYVEGERKIFGFIPNAIPWGLAFIQVCLSLFYISLALIASYL